MKLFDINENWVYFNADGDEMDNISRYWFDKEDYCVVDFYESNDYQKSQIVQNAGFRFVPFFKFNGEAHYKELIDIIDNKDVTEYFNRADTEYDKYVHYRCFIDWNCIQNDCMYDNYLKISRLVIKWCEKNQIKYKFDKDAYKTDYCIFVDNSPYKEYEWEIPNEP